MIGRGQHEHAAVVGLHTVELGKQLTDDAASGTVPHETALTAESIHLVEEQHARCLSARSLEIALQVLLALAKPHVQDIGNADGQEFGTELTGRGTRDERLPAARRSIEQQSSTQ